MDTHTRRWLLPNDTKDAKLSWKQGIILICDTHRHQGPHITSGILTFWHSHPGTPQFLHKKKGNVNKLTG